MEALVSASGRRWRNVPLVRERDMRRARFSLGLLLAIVASMTPFAVYLLEQFDYLHVRYKIEELRAQHDRLVEAERRLRIERAGLSALPRVEARAAGMLGLVHPLPEQVLVVRRLKPGSAVPRAPSVPVPVR